MKFKGTRRALWWRIACLPLTVLALGCDEAARSSDRRDPTVTPSSAATSDSASRSNEDLAQSASSDGGATLPIMPGTYRLITIRDTPLADDTAAARAEVEARLNWTALERARALSDSAALIAQTRPDIIDFLPEWELRSARTARDSAEVVSRTLGALACVEWIVGGDIVVDSSAAFELTYRARRFCRNARPSFTVRLLDRERGQLAATGNGRSEMSRGVYHHGWQQFGDMLILGRDCDGRDAFLLATAPERVASAKPEVHRLGPC